MRHHIVEAEHTVKIELPDGYIYETDGFLGGQRSVYNPETGRRFLITAKPTVKYEIQETDIPERVDNALHDM